MTKDEQKEFVRSLSKSIADSICEKIDAGKVPEDWDGHEFRVLLSMNYDRDSRCSLIRKHPQRKRARDFRNTALIENLY